MKLKNPVDVMILKLSFLRSADTNFYASAVCALKNNGSNHYRILSRYKTYLADKVVAYLKKSKRKHLITSQKFRYLSLSSEI